MPYSCYCIQILYWQFGKFKFVATGLPNFNNAILKLSSDSNEDSKREVDEILLMASQQYEEHERGQKSII